MTGRNHFARFSDRGPLLFFFVATWLPFSAGATPLPSRDPAIVLPHVRAFDEDDSFGTLVSWLGAPDHEVISGFSITEFRLRDGTSLWVKATPSRNRIFGISRSAPGRLAHVLYSPLHEDLMQPAPHSAPF